VTDQVVGSSPGESHNSSDSAYRVEVRAAYKPLVLPNGEILTKEWKPLSLTTAHNATGDYTRPLAEQQDAITRTMGYYAAMAVAAGFMSQFPWNGEARIVRYKRKLSWTLEREDGAEIVLEEAIMMHARLSDSADPQRKEGA